MLDSPFSLTKEQAEALASSLANGAKLTFSNMANRNWVAKLAKKKGVNVYKRSARGQLLDPRYVCDSVAEGHATDFVDRGLGNDYRHYWKVLYMAESETRPLWR